MLVIFIVEELVAIESWRILQILHEEIHLYFKRVFMVDMTFELATNDECAADDRALVFEETFTWNWRWMFGFSSEWPLRPEQK